MYYAREAYILSFEHSLCSSLSPNGKPHSRDFSDSLFLSTNWYANEEEYLTALMDQVLLVLMILVNRFNLILSLKTHTRCVFRTTFLLLFILPFLI